MGKGGSAKQQVNRYYMSMHFGICAELDAITGVTIGDKDAWSGELTAQGTFTIDRQDLFGGDKKEGGVQGLVHYLPGNAAQVFPTDLASRHGLTSTTSPAYRGLASVYFVGQGSRRGFYWGAVPYLQSVAVRARRAPKGLNAAYAMIGNQMSLAVSGYAVTIGTNTATVTDGLPTTIGAHSVTITVATQYGEKTILIDGLTIIVKPYTVDSNGAHRSGTTVEVESSSAVMIGGSVTLSGVTVTKSGSVIGISLGAAGQDANPAHIIYECLINTSWGMGTSTSLVDADVFNAVGRVLFHEGFGLSLQWTKEDAIENFVNTILDHIQGVLYVDPDTGKFTLKLLRDDYDTATLPLITPDNAVLDNYQRKLWGETVNEIVASWTNPINEQTETLTQQDLGNIAMQGATISDSRNYFAVRRADLAQRLANRDVRQSSAPLASVDALVDRSAWNFKPGSVLRVTWPEYDIEELIMRVMNVDYGKIGNPSIIVSLLEDIFSLEHGAVSAAALGGFVDPSSAPTPLNHVSIITAPAYFTSRQLSSADAAALQYPDVLVALLAASTNRDAALYELVGRHVLPNGTTVAEERGTKGLLGWTVLSAALPEEAVSIVPDFLNISNGIGPNVAGFVFIGNATERTMEIALLQSYDAITGWTLQRGVLDTVPRAWAAGTSVWFYDVRNDFFDSSHHSDAESVTYKLLTKTSRGTLDPADSPVYGATLTGRPHLPIRPANVKINGVAFGSVDMSASAPTSVPITWSTRNRTLEDSTVLHWTDGPISPEAGQTVTIVLRKTTDGSVITTISGLTGNSYDVPVSAFGSEIQADVVISSARAGLASLQSVVRRVRVVASGGGIGAPTTGSDTPYSPPTTYPDVQDPPRYCPVVTARVLLANSHRSGPGPTCAAGDLVAGQSWLWTQHEFTREWGAFPVVSLQTVEREVFAAAGYPNATSGHRFWIDEKWVRMREIGQPAGSDMVAQITVARAHTFVTVEDDGTQILSHNIKQGEIP